MIRLASLIKLAMTISCAFLLTETAVFAQQVVVPLPVADVETKESAAEVVEVAEDAIENEMEALVINPDEPFIETIHITPNMLSPQELKAYERSAHLKDGTTKGKAGRMVKKVLFFGWTRDLFRWLYAKPDYKESEKERKLREEWETMLGRDYFQYYYKAMDAKEVIEGKTTWHKKGVKYRLKWKEITASFKVFSFKAKATYEYFDQDMKVKFRKKF